MTTSQRYITAAGTDTRDAAAKSGLYEIVRRQRVKRRPVYGDSTGAALQWALVQSQFRAPALSQFRACFRASGESVAPHTHDSGLELGRLCRRFELAASPGIEARRAGVPNTALGCSVAARVGAEIVRCHLQRRRHLHRPSLF